MPNQLIALTNIDDLRSLRELYKSYGITQLIGYQTLDNYISWLEREPHQKHIKIYTLPEVWRKSGLYLIVDRYQLMVNALDTAEAANELRTALTQLDWSRGYKMTGVPDIHHDTIFKIVSDLGLLIGIVRLQIMVMPRAEALQLEVCIPSEYEFRPLSPDDAVIVNDIWYSRANGTLEFIKQLIRNNYNIGIYLKSTGELIAWCIRCNLGLLGMLHVKDAHRGRGLAVAMVHYLSRQYAQAGDDATTMISYSNTASISLFTKLNFRKVGTTHIFRTKRSETTEIWSDELEAREQ
ncbi:uncharacterized protein LOC105209754 [Zeugodacus cucurbitae]|uniref:uncharacterized protein LOC105209754 n=1 Tax=Zeugodacus cucurbitae TaxID=28588 RepID=UPI0023D930C4|nr:uncharacterized protein LOC105209754 [Zeugodacus cucurbitae]